LGLRKQAKVLTKGQIDAVFAFLGTTRHPDRNRAIFLLSVKAGLRAKEIAGLTWTMVTDAEGKLCDSIRLTDTAAKGRSGRIIPLNKELRSILSTLWEARPLGRASPYVIASERSDKTSSYAIVNKFAGWYRHLGFFGASSHSGRRTFITNAARRISTVGGSLRDVQMLAGHSSLSTTQRYIDSDGEAQRKVVELV
jgi:integrase/recombinase XerD